MITPDSYNDFILISLRKKNELYHRKYVNKILYFNEMNSQIIDSNRKKNNFFFTGGYDSIIKLWENNYSNKLRLLNNLEHHTHFITDLEISKKNNLLFSSSYDKLICFWDLTNIIDIQNFNQDEQIENTIYSDFNIFNFDKYILCLKYNELNDKLYSSDSEGNIISFDINKEYIINKENDEITKNGIFAQIDSSINSIDISIDGKILIASLNNEIIIIDNTTQKIISTLNGHNDKIIKVKLSLDGKKIISQSLDNTIKLWDIGEKKYTNNLDFINQISNFYPFKNFNDIILGFSNGELYFNNILKNESTLIERTEKEIKEIIMNDEEDQIIISNENGNLNIYNFQLKNKNVYTNEAKCIGEIDLNNDKIISIFHNEEKDLFKSSCEIMKNEIIEYSIMNNQIYIILKYNDNDKSDVVNLLNLKFVENNNYTFEYLNNILEEVNEDKLEKWNDLYIDTGILNIIFNENNCFKNDISNLNFNFIEKIIENEFHIYSSSVLYYKVNKNEVLQKNTFGSFFLSNLLIYYLNKNEIFDHLIDDLKKVYKWIEIDNLFISTNVKKKNYSFYYKDNNNPNIMYPYFCFKLFYAFNIYLNNHYIFESTNQENFKIKIFYFEIKEYLKDEFISKDYISFELKSYHTFKQLFNFIISKILNVEKIKNEIDSYFRNHINYTNEEKKKISSQDNLYFFFYFGVIMDNQRDSDNIIYLNKSKIYNYHVSQIIRILNYRSTFKIYKHTQNEEAVEKMNLQ